MPSTGLTGLEESLVGRVATGVPLDCRTAAERSVVADGRTIDENTMRSWRGDPHRTVRASVIRDIALGRLAANPNPHGLRLTGVHIAGRLDLENITSGIAIELSHCFIDQGIVARDADLTVAFSLSGSRIGFFDQEAAVSLERMRVPVLRLNGLTIDVTRPGAAVLLTGAHISGDLRCERVAITTVKGPAMHADGLIVGQNARLTGCLSTQSGENGSVRLVGAHIGGQLICSGLTIVNKLGPALVCDGLAVDQHTVFGGSRISGSAALGAARFPGAHVGGQLQCNGATIVNTNGPALNCDGLVVDQDAYITGSFATESSGEGTVRLVRAHIGVLHCKSATISNKSGPALNCDGLTVDGMAYLAGNFSTDSNPHGAIRLRGAHVGGQLDCEGATVSNKDGSAFVAPRLVVGQGFLLNKATGVEASGDGVALDLRDAKVGELLVQPKLLSHSAQGALAKLDGLVYSGLPQPDPDGWLTLIDTSTPTYAAQPYQQLAAAHNALGNDRLARQVLIKQRRRQLEYERQISHGLDIRLGNVTIPFFRCRKGCWGRFWVRITGVLLGYGYKPWRAVFGLIATIALAIAVAFGVGWGENGLAQPQPQTTTAQPTATPGCRWTETAAIGLDLGTPVIHLGSHEGCAVTNTGAGDAITVSGWVLSLFAWAFAALFVAGFTDAVRKP